MKRLCCLLQVTVFVVLVAQVFTYGQSRSNNSISGFVFESDSRTPVPDVFVELMDDMYSTLRRIKTDGAGRYFFTGMRSGRYKVKVMPFGTNFLQEVKDVEVVNYNVGSMTTSDNVYQDIYLKVDKRRVNAGDQGTTGTVFAQNVPAEAQNFYKKGVSQLGREKEAAEGLENLKKAVEIFPDYFDALSRLGIEYIRRDRFYDSLPHLIKAIQINQRSFPSFYALGIAAYNLKQMKEAAEAFRAATVLNPQSAHAYFQYGRASRINGNLKEAEKSLLKARDLAQTSPISEIHWQLGLLYDKTERFSQAADELETYLKVEPDIPNAQQIKDLIDRLRSKAQK